ncbi:MAG: transcriptional regulator [Rhodococcus sp.]|nr:transcriptional regulator [Rhodococcus sp. (in: high G+C Gram-positive bacteria)]
MQDSDDAKPESGDIDKATPESSNADAVAKDAGAEDAGAEDAGSAADTVSADGAESGTSEPAGDAEAAAVEPVREAPPIPAAPPAPEAAPLTPPPAPAPPAPATAYPPVKAEPTRVMPTAAPAPQPEGRKRKSGAILLLAGLVVAIALGVGAILLVNQHRANNSPEAQVQNSIDTFVAALDSGDLPALRSITCGSLAEYYNGLTDEQFAAVHQASRAQQSLPVIGPMESLTITGDIAIAQVSAHSAASPAEQSLRTFDLTRVNDEWKICEPQQELSEVVPE